MIIRMVPMMVMVTLVVAVVVMVMVMVTMVIVMCTGTIAHNNRGLLAISCGLCVVIVL